MGWWPYRRALLIACVALGCGDDDDGDGDATSGVSAPASVSVDDGQDYTCEPMGGMCECAGGCSAGSQPANGTCPQPPPESGACSLECCVPIGGTTTAGTTTAGTTTAGTTASSADASTTAAAT